jgi:hypothetical protein
MKLRFKQVNEMNFFIWEAKEKLASRLSSLLAFICTQKHIGRENDKLENGFLEPY